MRLSNIIKIFQTIKKFKSAQEFGLEIYSGEITRMWHAYWSLSMPVPNLIKIFQTIKKLRSAKKSGLEIRSVEITRKRTKQDLSFLHATLLCPYQILSTYPKQYGSYSLHKISVS